MLISRRGYNWNNVLSPNWWAYKREGFNQEFMVYLFSKQESCSY